MPESKKRKAAVAKKNRENRREIAENRELKKSPTWWAPVMVGLMVLGVVIIVTAYVSGGDLPIPNLDNGNINLFLGFGVLLAGFFMTMGWK